MVSSLGEKLRYLRESKGLKQEDIAQYLKVSRTSISKYESGDREPDIDTIKALSRFYNVPVDYMLGLTNSPYSLDKTIFDLTQDTSSFVKETDKVSFSITDPEPTSFLQSDDFIRLAKKIRDNNLDIKTVESIIDNIILLNKK